MINIDLLQEQLIVAMVVSVITVAFIQKTKDKISKKWLTSYTLLVNLVFGTCFTLTFTNSSILHGIWVGVFSFIGADVLYQSLEGKIKSYSDLVPKKEEVVEIPRGDI